MMTLISAVVKTDTLVLVLTCTTQFLSKWAPSPFETPRREGNLD